MSGIGSHFADVATAELTTLLEEAASAPFDLHGPQALEQLRVWECIWETAVSVAARMGMLEEELWERYWVIARRRPA
jgi:hypothetical protein